MSGAVLRNINFKDDPTSSGLLVSYTVVDPAGWVVDLKDSYLWAWNIY